jgi:uncharacterized protein DUF5908
MPIIINEIVFKGTIAEANSQPPTPGVTPPREPEPAIDREALVQLCVEEVLRILERQKER